MPAKGLIEGRFGMGGSDRRKKTAVCLADRSCSKSSALCAARLGVLMLRKVTLVGSKLQYGYLEQGARTDVGWGVRLWRGSGDGGTREAMLWCLRAGRGTRLSNQQSGDWALTYDHVRFGASGNNAHQN